MSAWKIRAYPAVSGGADKGALLLLRLPLRGWGQARVLCQLLIAHAPGVRLPGEAAIGILQLTHACLQGSILLLEIVCLQGADRGMSQICLLGKDDETYGFPPFSCKGLHEGVHMHEACPVEHYLLRNGFPLLSPLLAHAAGRQPICDAPASNHANQLQEQTLRRHHDQVSPSRVRLYWTYYMAPCIWG